MRVGINGRHLGPNKTGVGRYLLSLLNEWASSDKEHEFFVYYGNEELQTEDRAPFEKNPHMHLRHVRRPLGSFHLWYNFSLPAALHRDKIDVFFSGDYFLPFFRLRGMRTCMTIHDVSYLAHPKWFPPLYRLYCALFSKRKAAHADVIISVSDYSKKEILKYTQAQAQNVYVIHEAASDTFSLKKVTDRALPSDISLPYFLFVGKILNRRHVWELIRAFKLFSEQVPYPQAHLLLRGDNETNPHQDIEGLANGLNRELKRDAVRFLPRISDQELATLYQSTAGFFYLSSYEGFGLPVLEALACGAPTVTVRASSIPEVAGDAALYVDPTDEKEIALIMQRLLQDQSWLSEIREKSIEQAKKFSWEKAARQTLEIMETVHEQ